MRRNGFIGDTDTDTERITNAVSSKAGIYLHIPFCIRKCPYCDFYSTSNLSQASAFVDALIAEIRMEGNSGAWGAVEFDSVYIGGGTPTVMDTRAVLRIMGALYETFSISDAAEITIEANPATLSKDQLAALRKGGINRINIGIQSFDDANLSFLGRIHTGKDAVKALQLAGKGGFDNIGIDLMYGLPGQTPENWQKDLETAVSYGPAHISCYMLTFEPGTVMDNARKAGQFKVPGDRVQASLFLATARMLVQNGYDHYEISNFAKSAGLRSLHNAGYWNNRPYLGLGPAAHSYAPPVRKANVRSVRRYIGRMEGGKSPVESSEILDIRQQMMEAVYLGLRKADGIGYVEFNRRFQTDFCDMFEAVIDRLAKKKYLVADADKCRLTLEGMLLQESIAGEFIQVFS